MRRAPAEWFRLVPALASIALACATGSRATRPAVADTDVPPFRYEQRIDVYRMVDDAAWTLWQAPPRITGEREITREGQTVRLVVECRDGDGKPEAWALLPPGSKGDTADFGFFFDLNRDGRIDYVVFNGGPMFDRAFKTMSWMNYHWIDSDGDGRVDIVVYNDVDRDGDGFPDPGWTAWVYDRDGDGVADAAEYLRGGEAIPIARADGCLTVKRFVGEARTCQGDRTQLDALTQMLADIQQTVR